MYLYFCLEHFKIKNINSKSLKREELQLSTSWTCHEHLRRQTLSWIAPCLQPGSKQRWCSWRLCQCLPPWSLVLLSWPGLRQTPSRQWLRLKLRMTERGQWPILQSWDQRPDWLTTQSQRIVHRCFCHQESWIKNCQEGNSIKPKNSLFIMVDGKIRKIKKIIINYTMKVNSSNL